ncbi:unnamed protein product [Ilex paraguariensis]|uniref:Uncharacterized protein n=1 Tax=Ilex paraguariensis TaxID=185542 RepID=A0ABC8SAB3_9AQUA
MKEDVANLTAQLIGGQSQGGHSLIAWVELCFAPIEFLGFAPKLNFFFFYYFGSSWAPPLPNGLNCNKEVFHALAAQWFMGKKVCSCLGKGFVAFH